MIHRSIKNISIFILLVTIFISCQKEEDKVYLSVGNSPELSINSTSFILNANTSADTLLKLKWDPSNYGFNAAVSYTLQISKAGSNFEMARDIVIGNNLTYNITGDELNQLALTLGLKFGLKGSLEVRIQSNLSESVPQLFSNVITFDVTPYQVIINYPSLWVPGSYQGWNPATAPKISSILSNGIYEGYVNFLGADLQFKLTSQPDWNNGAFGWASSVVTGNNVTGKMNTTGGNLFVPMQGYYRLQANTIANEWAATLTTWTIIGDAPIASNNWSADIPMTFDPTTYQWSAVVECKAGTFKFRANADWELNLGDTGGDLILDYNGANLNIPTAGTYTIILDLKAGNYTYVIKQ
jgi:starch-binding outer membrane protein SusE/F